MDNILTIIKKEIETLNSKIDKDGELPLTERLHLFKGSEYKEEEKQLRRKLFVQTEIKCAEYTIDIWKQSFKETIPIDTLVLLKSNNNHHILKRKSLVLKTYLDNKFELGKNYFNAISAGFACWAAIKSFLYGIESCNGNGDEKFIDPTEWMACFYSSMAYSDGAIWDEKSDNKKRKEFWEWYINECEICTIKLLS